MANHRQKVVGAGRRIRRAEAQRTRIRAILKCCQRINRRSKPCIVDSRGGRYPVGKSQKVIARRPEKDLRSNSRKIVTYLADSRWLDGAGSWLNDIEHR